MPWKPNSVDPPAGTDPFHAALEKATEPDVPLVVAFHALLTAAPDGSDALTLHPFSGAEPAVTRTVATKPPVHWFTVSIAEHVPLDGGGVVGGGVVGGCVVGGGVVGGGVVPLALQDAVGVALLPFLYTVIPKSFPEPSGVAVNVPEVPVTLALQEFCNV